MQDTSESASELLFSRLAIQSIHLCVSSSVVDLAWRSIPFRSNQLEYMWNFLCSFNFWCSFYFSSSILEKLSQVNSSTFLILLVVEVFNLSSKLSTRLTTNFIMFFVSFLWRHETFCSNFILDWNSLQNLSVRKFSNKCSKEVLEKLWITQQWNAHRIYKKTKTHVKFHIFQHFHFPH